MQKACIVLEVPSIKQSYDILVPGSITVAEVIKLLGSAVRELSFGQYVPTGTEIIFRQMGNQLLSQTKTLEEYGITDGEHLMLY